MKKLYLILALIVTTLFVSCEAFQETTYQLYYDSFSGTDEVKRIEVREFNEDKGLYENVKTINLLKGERSQIYEISSDIAFLEITIVGQYNPTQEIYFIKHYYPTIGEDNLVRLSSLE
ncbi:MAG: hypothetical protein J6U84_07240 [Bacteroidales bacterium]|nr:hypothetical protein [Bacteroidales bacterium]